MASEPSASRPPRNAALGAARVSGDLTERRSRGEYDDADEGRTRQGSAMSSRAGGEEGTSADGRIDGGDEDDDDDDDGDEDAEGDVDEEEQEQDAAGNDTDAGGNDESGAHNDDLARLRGAVAKHRQVAALAGGAYPYEAAKPSRKAPSGRVSKAVYKRFSDARIQAIENVISPSPEDSGWLPPPATAGEATAIYSFIISTIHSHTLPNGRRCAQSLDPAYADRPGFLDNAEKPTFMADVEARISRQEYSDSRAFEVDLCQVFTTFRRGHPLGTQEHGDICILQRLYQRMTRTLPRSQTSDLAYVQNNLNTRDSVFYYSSVHFGPGHAQRGQQGTELTTRPVIKGKIYYTHAFHKGIILKVGDWVHLMNPADPTKPTLAQVFKISKREEDLNSPPLLSCCWYFRPEQTVHPPSRKFALEEVFKTGLFADHAVDDVLEQTHVLFFTKWTRGRPPPAIWSPKAPIYFCEARYNEKVHDYNIIKNWNSCLPEELRGAEQPLVPFSEPRPPPQRIESPFLRGVPGPGRLCDESEVGKASTDSVADPFAASESSSKKRKASDSNFNVQASGSGSRGQYPPQQHLLQQQQAHLAPTSSVRYPTTYLAPAGPQGYPPQTVNAAHRDYNDICGTMARVIGRREVERTASILSAPGAMQVDLYAVSHSLRGAIDVPTLVRLRDACIVLARSMAAGRGEGSGGGSSRPSVGPRQSSGMPPPSSTATPGPKAGGSGKSGGPSAPAPPPPGIERTLESALGGIDAYWETLPNETVERFGDSVAPANGRRARSGEGQQKVVQWYAGAPIDLVGREAKASHSLDYLHYRAMQKKREEEEQMKSETARDTRGETTLLELAKAWADVVADGEANRGLELPKISEGDDEDDAELQAKLKALVNELQAAQ
ncbi:hypothetical protein BDZ90DRAFT_232211 [Jaminaea rosea]|uniref:BAH domain-containing protein n=1 Tax=Jaminaea rosea TaxID=1569628 RepID=A0A316US64_9BASI|nr:hypothetical protein BDZ90DRAFT_232211 [Jaminaea rosea]PWN27824.1 hypothetical protein BDZ90DRAFT_232211 [Jaminaea rosea]